MLQVEEEGGLLGGARPVGDDQPVNPASSRPRSKVSLTSNYTPFGELSCSFSKNNLPPPTI